MPTTSPLLIKMLTDMSMSCHVGNHVMSLPGHVIVMCRADENSRVVLQYQRAQEGSDYINASFIDVSIRESVDSLCRDDADMPMPPYIRKACNHPNTAFVSLFRSLTMILERFSI